MAGQSNKDSDAGCLGWLIGAAIVIAIVVYSVSGIGHLLGLTPTGSEVLDSEDGFLAAHYEGVVVGYVLTVLVMVFPFLAYFGLRWWRANAVDTDEAFWRALGGFAVLLLALILFLPVGARETGGEFGGAGGNDRASPESTFEERLEARRQRQREHRRELRREAKREQRLAEAREERRAARQERRAEAQALAEPQPAASASCDPNYSGACLDPDASDYDCAGGEGDGPEYTGPVTVVGSDHFDLDTGDGDPAACEPY